MPKKNNPPENSQSLTAMAAFYGRDELEKRRSVLEGSIRNYLKLLSLVSSIKSRLDQIDRSVTSGVEDAILHTKRCNDLIESYNSDKNAIRLNLFHVSDMAVTIGEAAAEDRAFLEILEGIEEQGINTDLTDSADKIKSLYSIANLVSSNQK